MVAAFGMIETKPSFQVNVGEPALISPATHPQPATMLFLNNFDQHVFFNTDLIFFFQASSSRSQECVIELLRESLAKVLVPYWFLAGRYFINEDEGRLAINCNAAGVLFAGAESNISIDELGDFAAPNPAFKKLFLYPSKVCSIEDIPLLTVQVTKFLCGGLSVCFSSSHVALDGGSLCKFIKDYANIVLGSDKVLSAIQANPDRTFLRARSPLQISYSHNELMAAPCIPAKLLFRAEDYDKSSPVLPPNFACKTFHFTVDMLKSLKQRVVKESKGSIKFCSAFEVLSALIWQARTKALRLDSHAPSKLFLVVDFRKQLEASLPCGFVGNAIICAPCVDIKAEVVCESNLAFCVDQVRQAIANVTEEYVRSVVDWCENKHGMTNLPGGVLVTTWSKLGYEEVDFGWGKPAYVAPLVNSRHDFVTLVSSCKGDGGVDVVIGMQQQKDMNEFESYFVV